MRQGVRRPSAITVVKVEVSSNTNSPRDSPRRKKEAFLTSVSPMPPPLGRVQELYQQLNGVIDGMDVKIQDVINRHEAQFLLAYRNHMKKIKQQLEEIRSKTANAQANSNSFERITSLEKQLILFREEALKLYNNLEQKNRECQQYKLKLDEANSQNQFLEGQVKKLMKRAKYLEAQSGGRSVAANQQQLVVPELPIRHQDVPISRKLISRKIRTADTNRGSVASSSLQIQQRLRSIIQDETMLNNIRQVIVETDDLREKKLEQLNTKYEKVLRQTSGGNMRSNELEEFFFKCVETVRKEILKRTNSLGSFGSEFIDYKTFMKMDCLRVLELFVMNERVRNIIHSEMFARRTESTAVMYNAIKVLPSRGRSTRTAGHNVSLRNAYSQFIE